MLLHCGRMPANASATDLASAEPFDPESFNPERTTGGLVEPIQSMPTLEALSVSAIAKMGVNALKPFLLTIIDISMEFLTDIKDFDR